MSASLGGSPFKTASLWENVPVLVLGVSSAHGAVLWLYDQGTPDVGAAAGMAARADDAATAFASPAGMTRPDAGELSRRQAAFGFN